MKEWRCTNCNSLLAKVEYGKSEIKCYKCRTMNRLTVETQSRTFNTMPQVRNAKVGFGQRQLTVKHR